MKDLKITLVQTTLAWENHDENIAHFDKLISKLRRNSTHMVLLPEMFATGFTMNATAVAETMSGKSVTWMKQMAKKKNAVICGSLVIRSGGNYYNRLVWASPDGKVKHYDKRHLFRMAKEHKTYTAGKKKLLVKVNGWNVCPLVCYDLRFPVWSRSNGETDLMIFVANWPEKRSYAWKQLLIARAIENQCYVAGLNRVGTDGKEIFYSGDSVVLDPLGKPLSKIKPGKESVTTITISYAYFQSLRKIFPVMDDADSFSLKR